MLIFKLNTNQQTFNKNITTAEKSPVFTEHKSLTKKSTYFRIRQIISSRLVLLFFKLYVYF